MVGARSSRETKFHPWNWGRIIFYGGTILLATWDLSSRAVHNKVNPPQIAEELTVAFIEELTNISQEYITRLVPVHMRVNGLVSR